MADDKPKNLKMLVDVHHRHPDKPMYLRTEILRKGTVVAGDYLHREDRKFLLRAAHIEETDAAATWPVKDAEPVPAAAPQALPQAMPDVEPAHDEADHGEG